jgi:hypothetical protein
MKKVLLIPLLFAIYTRANAQSLTIVNNTDLEVTLIMYAQCPSTWGGSCSDFVSNTITISYLSTAYWSDPCDFESSTTYCSTCSVYPTCCASRVGWNSSCPALTTSLFLSFCGASIPSDFRWTAASFDVGYGCPGDYTGFVGDGAISCLLSGAYTCCGGCWSTGYVTWTPNICVGSSPCSVTITINPY